MEKNIEESRLITESSSSSNSGGFGNEGRSNSHGFNGPSGRRHWFADWDANANDPEFRRLCRVGTYNDFTIEAKLKSSVKKRLKWIKSKFTNFRSGL